MPRDHFNAFVSNREGTVIISFAVVAVFLMSLVGGAVDFAKAQFARTQLQTAADAAALASANDPYQSDENAKKVADSFFEASKTPLIQNVKATFKVNRSLTGGTSDVTISGSANIETSLLTVIGVKTLAVSAVATASRPLNFLDVYVAVDMSASMGIAADQANRDKMVALTKPYSRDGAGCAFACHMYDAGVQVPAATTYDFARNNGIRLREDVMSEAFAAFVDEMLSPTDASVKAGMWRIGTYGFSNTLKLLQEPTSNGAQVKASLGLFPDADRINSRFPDALTALNKEIGKSGNGSVNNPRKMLLFITDGVQWLDWGKSFVGSPLDPANCDTLKKNGVLVAVLEVQYFKDMADTSNFVPFILPFYDQITPSLQACASPGFYFKVADSANAQMQDAFTQVARGMKPALSLTK